MANDKTDLTEEIKRYPNNTAIIRLRNLDGEIVDWAISAHSERDNEKTLKRHLSACRPGTEFIDFIIR